MKENYKYQYYFTIFSDPQESKIVYKTDPNGDFIEWSILPPGISGPFIEEIQGREKTFERRNIRDSEGYGWAISKKEYDILSKIIKFSKEYLYVKELLNNI